MAKQTKQSSLKAKLGSVRGDSRYKPAEAPGGGGVPAGISGGIAKLTRLDFDVMESGDYKGEQRLYAHGVCIHPKTFKDSEGNVHKTEGGLVQLSKINLCDTSYNGTTTPFAENWSKAENRLKLLGVPTEDMDDDSFEDDVLQFVKDNELYFRFRTWKPKDRDQVSIVLEGPTTYDPDALEDDVQDEQELLPGDAPVEREPKAKEPEVKQQQKSKKKEQKPEPPAPEPAVEESEEIEIPTDKDLLVLGKKGDKGDISSQQQLTKIADQFKIDVGPFGDWSEVAAALLEENRPSLDQEDEEAQEEEVQEELNIEVGDLYMYKTYEVEVLSVNEKSKTVEVKNLKLKKVIKNVAWSDLSRIE
jgi:hypothetical protein